MEWKPMLVEYGCSEFCWSLRKDLMCGRACQVAASSYTAKGDRTGDYRYTVIRKVVFYFMENICHDNFTAIYIRNKCIAITVPSFVIESGYSCKVS